MFPGFGYYQSPDGYNYPVILYSDADLLVINKPSGLLSIPDGYNPALPSVQTLLEEEWGRLYIVHRLDKDTSGVFLLARTPETHRTLDRQFADRKVKKIYHALCIGTPTWKNKTIKAPLRVNGDRSHRTIVDAARGKPAQTEVTLLEQFQGYCLIEAQPTTGYTHQIRAHLSSIGHPILGDPLYRLPPNLKSTPIDLQVFHTISRTALHAFSISFFHPVNAEWLTIQAPYPTDIQNLLSLPV